MDSERNARIIAGVGTALIAALVCLLLTFTDLKMVAMQPEEPERGEILLIEEEYVEIIEPEAVSTAGENQAASYLDEPEHNEAQPTPASGTDVVDNGPKAEPTPVVTSKEPSPVKEKVDKPKDQGAIEEQKRRQEQEEVRRKANNEVANAFKNSSGKNNAATSSGKDTGKNGERTADRNSQGATGTGTGQVGGGWIIPKYAPVRSNYTGSVKMVVKIDNTGKVISVTFNGGEPPAATNSEVKAAVEREIRAHKFSRTNYDGAEGATAYITYTFK